MSQIPPDRHSLVVEDKIALLNRLSAFYKMSEFFFSLDKDTVRTANDHDILAVSQRVEIALNNSEAADRIKEICDRLKLLEINGSENTNIMKKKNLLRRKLLKLTQNLGDNH